MQKKHLVDYFFCAMRNMKHSIKCCNKSELSLPQLIVLKIINEHWKISNKQIAEELNITNASMSAMIKKLEFIWYITQQKSKTDKRVSYSLLSKSWLEVLEKTRKIMIKWSETSFKKLTKTEKEQLTFLLQKIC